MKVLAGYDGSPGAASAITAAAALFPGAHAYLAHVWMPPFTAHPAPAVRRKARTVEGLIRTLERQGQSRSHEVLAEGARLAEAAGWSVERISRRGFAGQGLELARLAEEICPDVLIVGGRGLSGVRALLGSVSDAAAHYSPVPVLVVPPPKDPQQTATGPVITAYDGTEGSGHALAAARRLWPSREHVVASVASRAAEDLEAERGLVPAVLAPKGMPETARSIADALAVHAAEVGAAVIVVGSRGRPARSEVLLGSVAMATLHHAHRPVLAVPPPGRLAHAAQAAGARAETPA